MTFTRRDTLETIRRGAALAGAALPALRGTRRGQRVPHRLAEGRRLCARQGRRRPRGAPRAARRHGELERVHLGSAAARGARRQCARLRLDRRHSAAVRAGRGRRPALCRGDARARSMARPSWSRRIRRSRRLPTSRARRSPSSAAPARTISPSRRCARSGLTLGDIEALDLGPPDAAPAFANSQIDAWVIWDPYYAIAAAGARYAGAGDDRGHRRLVGLLPRQRRPSPRPTRTSLAEVIDELAKVGADAQAHLDDTVDDISAITGVPVDIQQVALTRKGADLGAIQPLDETVLAYQQALADEFYELKIMPKPSSISARRSGTRPA